MSRETRIEKAKWFNNADSPVMFMVDDFTNVWIDLNNNGRVDPGEDWGHAMNSPGSSFARLTEQILSDYPAVKTTFFAPMARVPVIKNHRYNAHFAPINENEKTAAFFRSVHQSERFEVVYHGLSHGVNGARTEDFVHEWVAYKSLDEALETIEKGKKIYFEVFGEYPSGGKYCGYEYNAFSDESIDRTGFLWWCRKWDRGQAGRENADRFDIKYFGENRVIDIPSTLYGALFNLPKKKSMTRGLKKAMILRRGTGQIEHLLKNRLVISIQEHFSPARTDGRRQTPNTFDDRESLRAIFEYLKSKNIWYCTGTELAEYVYCRDNVRIEEQGSTFRFSFTFGRNIRTRLITLIMSDEQMKRVRLPNGEVVEGNQGIFNVPVMDGAYELM